MKQYKATDNFLDTNLEDGIIPMNAYELHINR